MCFKLWLIQRAAYLPSQAQSSPARMDGLREGWGPGLEKVKDTKCSLGCRKHQELSKGAQLSARLLPGATAAWEWLNIAAPSKDLWEDNLSIFIPALSEHLSTPAALGCSPELPHPVSPPEKARVIQVVGVSTLGLLGSPGIGKWLWETQDYKKSLSHKKRMGLVTSIRTETWPQPPTLSGLFHSLFRGAPHAFTCSQLWLLHSLGSRLTSITVLLMGQALR